MADESAVMEPEAETKARKAYTPLTNEQKEAATLRRDATLLAKYGNASKAAELVAQADKLAPERSNGAQRINPLIALNAEDQGFLRTAYFETTKAGFAKIAALVSYKKLAEIVEGAQK
jgi:hypothetical protein